MKEIECIRDLHCGRCIDNKDSPSIHKNFYKTLQYQGKIEEIRDFKIAKGCRFLQLYSDRIIDVGPDSLVLESDDPEKIIKLYPDNTEEDILFYKRETDKVAKELNGTTVVSSEGEFSLNICTIENILLLKSGCCIATQKKVSGLNEEQRQRKRWKEGEDSNIFDTARAINWILKQHFITSSKINSKSSFFSLLEVKPLNMKVILDTKEIFITDLAGVIRVWNENISRLQSDKIS